MSRGISTTLAEEFRRNIEDGRWVAGTQLPTTRALATQYRVSVNTVQSAFRLLEPHGIIERRPRRGGFVKGRSRRQRKPNATTIGVFSQAISWPDGDDWTLRIVKGINDELIHAGFHPSLFNLTKADEQNPRRLHDILDAADDRLAGVIGFPEPAYFGLLPELDRREIPWVSINRPADDIHHNYVTHHAFNAARLLGRCVARLKLSRVAILSVSMATGRTASEKYFGFMQGYVERGMLSRNVDFCRAPGGFEPAGYGRLKEHVERFGPPQVVFASGDLLAAGAIRYLREAGLKMPDQVKVIGSTGLTMGQYTHPSLSVLPVPMEELGHEAARMVLEMSRTGQSRLPVRTLSAPIVIRESFPIPQQLLEEEASDLGGL